MEPLRPVGSINRLVTVSKSNIIVILLSPLYRMIASRPATSDQPRGQILVIYYTFNTIDLDQIKIIICSSLK